MQDPLVINRHQLRVLRPDEVSRRWDEISGFLDMGSEFGHGDFVIDDIKVLVDEGKAFIVVLEDGGRMILASACEVISYPRRSVMNVMAIGGSGLDVMFGEFWSQVADMGRILGVDAVRGSVRPSMQRYCKRIAPDATVAYNVLERAL